jgi:hypothetical protein
MSQVPVEPPATISTGKPGRLDHRARRHERRQRRARRGLPRLPADDVGAVARVALQPAESERRLRDHGARQRERGLAGATPVRRLPTSMSTRR